MAVTDVWTERWQDSRQRGWLRVTAYAEAKAGPNGHCPLTTGELRRALDMDRQQVTRAIDLARQEGWLHESSTARCLVLPRASTPARCPAIHRGGE